MFTEHEFIIIIIIIIIEFVKRIYFKQTALSLKTILVTAYSSSWVVILVRFPVNFEKKKVQEYIV